jgi:hypothetical protein
MTLLLLMSLHYQNIFDAIVVCQRHHHYTLSSSSIGIVVAAFAVSNSKFSPISQFFNATILCGSIVVIIIDISIVVNFVVVVVVIIIVVIVVVRNRCRKQHHCTCPRPGTVTQHKRFSVLESSAQDVVRASHNNMVPLFGRPT